MSQENTFRKTVGALYEGMESFITSKTVVGEPICVGETTIIPLIEASFGMGAKSNGEEKKDFGGGGMGGKMVPTALLVIQNGSTKLVNVKNNDSMARVIDMVPDIMNKVSAFINPKSSGVDKTVIFEDISLENE